MKPNDYVEQHGAGWRVRGSRVSLDSVVAAFRDGLSPETIARECFPTLSLEQVYGVIAFYLARRAAVDAAGQAMQAEGEAWRQQQRAAEPGFGAKMAPARRDLLTVCNVATANRRWKS